MWRLTVVRRHSAWLFAVALSLATFAGCLPPQKSQLLEGQKYTSGQERYDGFFSSVAELRARTENLEGERPLRAKVAVAVGLTDSAKLTETIDAAKAKSADLKKDGGRFYVVVATEPKLILKKGAEESKDATDFAAAVDAAIKAGIQRSNELESIAKEAADLEQGIEGLEKELDSTFPEAAKRDEVKVELDASREILERAKLKAGTESGQALRFVVLLASAVDSGAAELLAMEASQKQKEDPPKPKWKGRAVGAGKPAKPKPKQDFDP
jgi:outer membrane murein-binding lipoprotein Lpp